LSAGPPPQNWAIVVGVDAYSIPTMSLHGAVRDALAMREWLLSASGGNVPEDQLTLLLSPHEGKAPEGITAEPATLANITKAIAGLLTASGEKGERLYFFFAGHGIAARLDNREVNAIVASDFTWDLTQNSMALFSVTELLETTQFADQFFFVDACRNIPKDRTGEDMDLIPGRWGRPRERKPGQQPVQQFILHATSPGLRAVELPEERGAFTDALVAGLGGAGAAKAWSPASGTYEVRWERLVKYVRGAVEARELPVEEGAEGPVYQIPQDSGTSGVAGRDDPVIVSLPAETVDPLTLTVTLSPNEVASVARVQVLDELADIRGEWTIEKGEQVTFDLPPRTYALRAWAPEHQIAKAMPPVELYESKEEKLELRKGDAVPLPTAEEAAAGAKGPAARGSLAVRCDDPLTSIEVLDSAGVVIAVATGRLHLPAQPTGFYRVRLRLPEGPTEDQLVELLPGEVEEAAPAVPDPEPEVVQLVEAVEGRISGQKLITVSEAVGPMAAVRPSTLLALAGAWAVGDGGDPGPFAALGLPALEPLPAGVDARVLVLAVDTRAGDAGAAPGLRVRLWPLDGPVPDEALAPEPAAKAPHVTQAEVTATAGRYWLSLEPEGGAPMVFALTALEQRTTLIVAQLDAAGVHLHQYQPRLEGDPGARARLLRRLETAQRLLLGGGLEAAGLLARDLAHAESPDPLGAALGGYVLLRLGLAGELKESVERLAAGFPELSDAHVLQGEVAASEGRAGDAEEAFRKANETGIPVFGAGLARLVEAARAYGLDQGYVGRAQQVFERHMTGAMWSVWLPEKLEQGKPLGS
jgi:Caspase domain